MTLRRAFPALLLSLSFSPAALAQTPLEFDSGLPDPLPPGVADPAAPGGFAPGAPGPGAAGLPLPPLPEGAVEQAGRQREGDFGPMLRQGAPGG